MGDRAVISLTTGLEDPEKVAVAFLVAVGAAESSRPTLMFLTKEAVRLAVEGVAVGTACEGCPPLPELVKRYAAAGGRCPARRNRWSRSSRVRRSPCAMDASICSDGCGPTWRSPRLLQPQVLPLPTGPLATNRPRRSP